MGRFATPDGGAMERLRVPDVLKRALQAHYTSLAHLEAALEDLGDAQGLVQGLKLELDVAKQEHMARTLLQEVEGLRSTAKRERASLAQEARQPRLEQRELETTTEQAYQRVLEKEVVLVRKIRKTGHHRALSAEEVDPTKLEENERNRWAAYIAEYVKEAQLPAAAAATQAQDESALWLRICAGRRAATLRTVVRTWKRFQVWLLLVYGRAWPTDVVQIINFLNERALEPCGHSVPATLMTSLSVLEQVGDQPKECRLSSSSLLTSFIKGLETDLQRGAPPRKSAQPYTVAMILAAELAVVDGSAGGVHRVFAFLLLIMVWCSLRVDDVQWLDRASFVLNDLGFRAFLRRSKTTGPGKRVRDLPVFIHRQANLSGKDWLATGLTHFLEMMSMHPACSCLGKPEPSGAAFSGKYLNNSDFNCWMKCSLGQLRAPVRHGGGWRLSEALLVPEESLGMWSGHSARHNLASWAAAMGVGEEKRNYLGRWEAGKGSADVYVVTARQIVLDTQLLVLQGLSAAEKGCHYDEAPLLEDLWDFTHRHGGDGRETVRLHTVWRRSVHEGGQMLRSLDQRFPMLAPTGEQIGVVVEEDPLNIDVPRASGEAPFWVSVSRRTGFRRLHRRQGCGVSPHQVYDARDLWQIEAGVADAKCKKCFCKGAETDSSSGSSSSS